MRVVTTCHKAGFDQYGHRCLESWKNWPKDAELFFYAEGFDVPPTDGVVQKKQPNDLINFKERYFHYEPHSYLFDVCRFSNKVFAAVDALFEYKGLGVWLDADCVTFNEVTEEFIRSQIPQDCYIAMFKRPGMYTETGFWIIDCSHKFHQEFMHTWRDWYMSNAFKQLSNWTDCETLDATVRKFEREGLIKSHNLSPAFNKNMHPICDPAPNKNMHPICDSEIGKRIDHCKGNRKTTGVSPENKNRCEHS